MESLVGRTLGKYELTAMIGGGGMATVYKAYHPGLDQQVAVKILHPFLSTDPSFIDRFRREARAVATLRHPNIVRVLDFDHEEHLYYMVMEYIDGPTLSTVLGGRRKSGGLSLPEIGRIFPPLCSAIDYAAGRGMVHRDIKPANIIMSGEGEPILTDYGIAKMIGSTSLTSPGTVVGSAHYMSPEQAQGQECDVRSDLYSLGIVLFECLAGTVPFDGDTTVTVLVKHISAPVPSVRALRPNLPPAVEPMLARALAKQPQDRYEMGAAFSEALVSALSSTDSTLTVAEVAAAATLSDTVPSEIQTPPIFPAAAAPSGGETAPPAATLPSTADAVPPPTKPEPTAPQANVSASEAALLTSAESPSAADAATSASDVALTAEEIPTPEPPGEVPASPAAPVLGATAVEQPLVEHDAVDSPTVESEVAADEAVEREGVEQETAQQEAPGPAAAGDQATEQKGDQEEAADSTLAQDVAAVEAATILAAAQGESPLASTTVETEVPGVTPPAPATTLPEASPAAVDTTPTGKVGQPTLDTAEEAEPAPAAAAARGKGGPPARRKRTRLLIVAGLAIVLLAAIGAGTTLALQAGSSTPTTTLPVTTTGTTSLSTTTSSSTTSTTLRPTTTTRLLTTTTRRITTTTLKVTTTTAKPTTTTAKPTTTVRRTTTTAKPTTTQTTSPPDTIGPGTTTPPDTIGPG